MKKCQNLILVSFIVFSIASFSFSCSEKNGQSASVIYLKTNLTKGDTIALRVGINNSISDSLTIDFGSGTLISFKPSDKVFGRSAQSGKIVTDIEAYQTIKYPVEGSIIKIYSPKKSLIFLKCSQNKISYIDLSNSLGLNTLDISYNLLTDLDLTNSKILKSIQCQNNSIKKIHIPELNIIRSLDCSNNNLIRLNTQKCKWLEKLKCSNNFLTKLQFVNKDKINELKCDNNSIAPDSIPYFNNISNYYLPQDCNVLGFVEKRAKLRYKTPEIFVVDESYFIPMIITETDYESKTDILTINFKSFQPIQIKLNGRNPIGFSHDKIKTRDAWYYLDQDGRIQLRSCYFNDIQYIANTSIK
ncbi:MAG: hypothetical protein ABJN84_07930 [Flavobacteriaceae bacterium]